MKNYKQPGLSKDQHNIKTPQSTSTLRDFDFLGKLGQGSFGVVYKVKRKVDNSQYVMKQINISKMNSRMKADAINEVTILSKLNHQNIVKYFDSFIDKNQLNIVMEFCEGGDFSQLMKSQFGRPLKEEKIWKYFIQMTMGLEYIHKRKILHRDIKTMNVFLHKDDIRIGDLGVAKVLQDNMDFARTMVGTPFYLSPEMCEEKPYNEKSDMWALGCVLYEMCTFKHPFEAKTQGALMLRIIRGKYNPISATYSQDLIDCVDLLLKRDYRARPSASQILSRASVQKKANDLSINLHPISHDSRKSEYVQKEKVESKPANSQSSLDQNSNKIKQIQQKIEKNNVVKTPSNKSDLEQEAGKQGALKYKDPTKQVGNNGKINYHYRNKDPLPKRPENAVGINRQQLKEQKQVMQKPISDQAKKDPQSVVLNAYNDKHINPQQNQIGYKRPSGVNNIQQQQPSNNINNIKSPSPSSKMVNQQQPKIKQGGFNAVSQQQQPDTGNSGNKVKKNDIPIYPYSRQVGPKIQSETPKAQPQKIFKRNSEKDLKSEEDRSTPSNNKYKVNNNAKNNIFANDRENVSRIRKGAPQQLSRQAQQAGQKKQLFGASDNKPEHAYLGNNHPFSINAKIKQKSQSEAQKYDKEDYEEVMNLPDKVSKGKNDNHSRSDNGNEKIHKQSSQPVVHPHIHASKSNQQLVSDQKKEKVLSAEELEEQQVFNRKLHDERDIVKLLDDHFQKEDQKKNILQNQSKPSEKSIKAQEQVSDKFIDDEFKSSSEEEQEEELQKQEKNKNENKQNVQIAAQMDQKKLKQWNKDQNIFGEEKPEKGDQYVAKKEVLDLKKLIHQEEESEQSTQIQDSNMQNKQDDSNQSNDEDQENEEQEFDEEEFTVQSNNEDEDEDNISDNEDNEKDQEEQENEEDDGNNDQEVDEDENNEDDENQNASQNSENDGNVSDTAYYDDEEGDNENEEDKENQQESQNDQEGSDYEEDEEEEEKRDIEADQEGEEDCEKKKIILQKKLDEAQKRQNELQHLLNIKTQDCVNQLGNDVFNDIMKIFRVKLNSDYDLTNDDQEEIDNIIQEHVAKHRNPQLIYTVFKILHLEIEIEKPKEKIAEIIKKIQLLEQN